MANGHGCSYHEHNLKPQIYLSVIKLMNNNEIFVAVAFNCTDADVVNSLKFIRSRISCALPQKTISNETMLFIQYDINLHLLVCSYLDESIVDLLRMTDFLSKENSKQDRSQKNNL